MLMIDISRLDATDVRDLDGLLKQFDIDIKRFDLDETVELLGEIEAETVRIANHKDFRKDIYNNAMKRHITTIKQLLATDK